LDFH